MSTEKNNQTFKDYFDEEPEPKKEDKVSNKNIIEYKIPKPKLKKNKSIVELEDINLSDYMLVNEEDDIMDLKNELDIEYLEEQGYKLVPIDLLQNYFPNKKILDQDIILPENEIASLEEQLQGNPCDYNCLIKLIDLYKISNSKEKLKQIRVYTQNLYPLSQGNF